MKPLSADIGRLRLMLQQSDSANQNLTEIEIPLVDCDSQRRESIKQFWSNHGYSIENIELLCPEFPEKLLVQSSDTYGDKYSGLRLDLKYCDNDECASDAKAYEAISDYKFYLQAKYMQLDMKDWENPLKETVMLREVQIKRHTHY